LAATGPTGAMAAPGTATTTAGPVIGDPPLADYPGLPGGGVRAATVPTTATPCDNNGSHQILTRAQVLTRAQSWLDVGGVQYSQSRCYRNTYGDYRTDCSGFVSMAWGLGGRGSDFWTGNLDDVSWVIPRSSLQPGDALLRHENNPSVDHVALFVGWEDSAHTRPVVIEQTGSSGTIRRAWSQSNASNYTPVRYDHVVDGSAGGVATGDVTGDGKADLVARRADGTLWLYRNSGSATPYGTSTQIGVSWGQFAWFLAGDVDGDGRADIVAARPDGTLWLYTNNGGTTAPYSTGTQIGIGWQQFAHVVVEDVTGDGRGDIVAAGSDGALRLYTNGGDTTAPYSTGTQVGVGWQSFDRITLGDVDGDHRADIVATKPDGTLWQYLNGGSDTAPYSSGTQIGTGWQSFV
ncbi:VCBS repeat-containing protein, partial [Actinosynnema sp. NPDC023658]|uniref:C40 family peptidase n=1 Tax=Actinosynnema sp. NPDC023658 TaxID=3155465 RepID=UPI00340064EF